MESQIMTPAAQLSPPSRYRIRCFEKSLTKPDGKAGFADVWEKDHFAWEYKGKEPVDDPGVAAIGAAMRELVRRRDV